MNVEGTRRMARVRAQLRTRLERFSYVSTAYVAGEPRRRSSARTSSASASASATPTSARSSRPSWRCASEGADLPLQILRPSIVVGDSSTGRTSSFNVLYGPLEGLRARRDPRDPGAARLAGRHRARRLRGGPRARARHARPGRTFHLVAGRNATTVGRLLELSAEELGARRPDRVAAAPVPRAGAPVAAARATAGLRRMEVYFPYFAMRVRFDDRRLGPGPRVEGYFHRLVRYAAGGGLGPAGRPYPCLRDREARRADRGPLRRALGADVRPGGDRGPAPLRRGRPRLPHARARARARAGVAARHRRRRGRARAARRGRRRPRAARDAAQLRGAARRARGGDPPRDGRARPQRRQGRDRRDPPRHRRGGGRAVRRRPLPDARPLRRAARLQARADRASATATTRSRSRARAPTASSSTRAARTACSACRRPSRRGASTPRPPRSPCCRRPRTWTCRSTRTTSRSTSTARPAPAASR